MKKSESKYFNTARKMNKALIELLETKDFDYITIKEICEKAEVNRSTFYLHYENTRDLLIESIENIRLDFLKYFNADKNTIKLKIRNGTLKELNFITSDYLIPFLNFIKDNRRIFKITVSKSSDMDSENIFRKMFQHVFNPIMERFNCPEDERIYIINFYINGITAVIMEWIKNECSLSPEKVCCIIKKCILNNKDYY